MLRQRLTTPRFQRRVAGWPFGVTLAVALAALAVLLAYSVRREAAVRPSLIVETHRGVAELVAARLVTELVQADRAIDLALTTSTPTALSDHLVRIEQDRPWLSPLAIVPGAGGGKAISTTAVGSGPGLAAFDDALSAAEREELAAKNLDAAVAGYSRAVALAPTPADRLSALSRAARSLLKAGRPSAGAAIYRQIIATANPLVPAETRWALIARSQLLQSGPPANATSVALETYRFLLDYRFFIDPDEWQFYASRALDRISGSKLTEADAATLHMLDARHARLVPLDARTREGVPDELAPMIRRVVSRPTASVVYVLRPETFTALAGTLLAGNGPWTTVGVAVLDGQGQAVWSTSDRVPDDAVVATPGGGDDWRIAAFPRDGSIAAVAARETRRYGLWLALLFGAVALALVLVARSVAREMALARLRADFVASVSHELKTPLSLIRMFGESLREGWVGESQKADYYEVITRESERLTGLIDNVLDFSRLEAGTRQYRFAAADLLDVVDSLLARYAFHLKAANVDLAIERPEGPIVARIDRDAVEQVLVNLLSNAVKYMGDAARSPRRVTVSLAREAQRARLSVSDTGIGMSPADRARVFDRFYRAADERACSAAGSGLGLTLVRAHVEAHGGVVTVESTLDQGSTFTIDLPLLTAGATS